MGVSIHSSEYDELKEAFKKELSGWIFDADAVSDLTRKLFSIMNDYNAVDWT